MACHCPPFARMQLPSLVATPSSGSLYGGQPLYVPARARPTLTAEILASLSLIDNMSGAQLYSTVRHWLLQLVGERSIWDSVAFSWRSLCLTFASTLVGEAGEGEYIYVHLLLHTEDECRLVEVQNAD